MAKINDFTPYLIAMTGSLNTAYSQAFLTRAIQSFMVDTRIARDEVYIDLDCHQKDFLLNLPECRSLVTVEKVWESSSNAGLLDEDTWSEVESKSSGSSGNTYSINSTGTAPNRAITLQNASSTKKRICVVYSWKIQNAACNVPDFILDDWVNAIINKAMVFAHSSLDFEQRNSRDKIDAQAMYDADVNNAQNLLQTQYSKGIIRIKTPRFF